MAIFGRFLSARLLGTMAAIGAGFTVAAIRQWDVSDGLVGWFTAALLLGQTVGNLIAGFIADRYGHRITLLSGCFSQQIRVIYWRFSRRQPSGIWGSSLLWGSAPASTLCPAFSASSSSPQCATAPPMLDSATQQPGLAVSWRRSFAVSLASWSFTALFAVSALMGLAAVYVLKTQVTEPRTIKQHFHQIG